MSRKRVHIDRRRRLIARWIFFVAALVLWLRKAFASGDNSDRSDKSFRVVLVEPYGMGDVISLQPLVLALLRNGIDVDLFIQKKWNAIFVNLPIQLHEISAPWSELGWIGSVKWMWRTRMLLNAANERVIGIDSRADCRSTLFLAMLGCSEIVLPNYFLGTDAKTPSGPWRIYDDLDSTVPRWKLNLQVLEPLGVTESVDSIPAPNLECLISNQPASDGGLIDVGILPCVPWPGKEWLPSRWQSLLNRFAANGKTFRVICGPGQRLEAAKMTAVPTSEISEASSIPELAAILNTCRIIVSLDSGPLHLAAALKLPIVGIYGPAQLPMWQPNASYFRVVSRQSDFADGPIHHIQRNLELSQRMMAAITVDDIWSAYLSLSYEILRAGVDCLTADVPEF